MQKRILWLLLVICSLSGFSASAQNQEEVYPDHYGKRIVSEQEIAQLALHRDTLIRNMNRLYKLEKKANAPGKYQPERIALVRQYLLLFEHLEAQADFVYYSKSDVIRILGRPDSTYHESGFQVYAYNSINNRYFRIKNIQYNLVFKDNELVFVRRKGD